MRGGLRVRDAVSRTCKPTGGSCRESELGTRAGVCALRVLDPSRVVALRVSWLPPSNTEDTKITTIRLVPACVLAGQVLARGGRLASPCPRRRAITPARERERREPRRAQSLRRQGASSAHRSAGPIKHCPRQTGACVFLEGYMITNSRRAPRPQPHDELINRSAPLDTQRDPLSPRRSTAFFASAFLASREAPRRGRSAPFGSRRPRGASPLSRSRQDGSADKNFES